MRPNANRSRRKRHAVFERDGWLCQYCGIAVKPPAVDGKNSRDMASLDHVIPTSLGGGWEDENLRTACFSCNSTKRQNSVEWLRMFFALSRTKYAEVITLSQYHQLIALGVALEPLPVKPFFFESLNER